MNAIIKKIQQMNKRRTEGMFSQYLDTLLDG